MSELKAFTFGLGQNSKDGSPCVVAFDDENNPRLASDEKFYIKSEADKVIADLEESHKMEVEQLLIELVKLKKRIAELEKENESLKYSVAALETDLAMSQRWRKCSEELPEEYTDVLFVDSDGTYYLGDMMLIPTDGIKPAEQYWSGRGEPRCNNPKYWLPLPKAPEAK